MLWPILLWLFSGYSHRLSWEGLPIDPRTQTFSINYQPVGPVSDSTWQYAAVGLPTSTLSYTVNLPSRGEYRFQVLGHHPSGLNEVLTTSSTVRQSAGLFPYYFSWQLPPSLRAFPIESYALEVRPAGATQWRVIADSLSGDTNSYVLQLPIGSYEYLVRATVFGNMVVVTEGTFDITGQETVTYPSK